VGERKRLRVGGDQGINGTRSPGKGEFSREEPANGGTHANAERPRELRRSEKKFLLKKDQLKKKDEKMYLRVECRQIGEEGEMCRIYTEGEGGRKLALQLRENRPR